MKETGYKLTKYILMFMTASFIGWVYEIICMFVLFRIYADRGVLHLPMCPIYGFGILVLYFIFRKVKNPGIIFFGSVFITTAVEYFTYVFVEYRFHRILWTYESWPLNYKGRISAVSSLIFGIMATLFLKLMVPLFDKLFGSRAKNIAATVVTAISVFCIFWELRFLGA